MNKCIYYVLFLIILFVVPCAVNAQEDYVIGPEDVLEISVWGHDDLTRTLPVTLEGKIAFPLIGEVIASGKTAQTLSNDLAQKLGDGYIVNPQVTVTVKDKGSMTLPKMSYFFVMGEIKKPGQYPLERGTTVLMAISIGGGLTDLASQKRTKIIREVKGKKTEIKVTMDTLVQSGDTIIVPERFF